MVDELRWGEREKEREREEMVRSEGIIEKIWNNNTLLNKVKFHHDKN